jgi:hypothetical protein
VRCRPSGTTAPSSATACMTRARCHSALLLFCSPYRDSSYKRELGRQNDRRPSSKPASHGQPPNPPRWLTA